MSHFPLSDVNYLRFVSGSRINIGREFRLLWVITFHCMNVSGVAEDNTLLLRSRSCWKYSTWLLEIRFPYLKVRT